ncbi:MAG: hypothetical protein IPK74_11190 [Deltaproteobacteria bacterium]|nr:hypothetical protein [Deltaproteobacteria bacterium]
MRVVGPTIVEPWRKRISAAGSLAELRALRAELVKFRVLDPACGSGNFLYVAFREMYRLENEILGRMHEFPEIANDPKQRGAWGSGIPTTNFYGIDINAFAVELARATLNIAKKIAFEDRRAFVAERFGQVELELDPSLPLDNLEGNIVCADALFTEWPEVEAIVGNPPILGDRKIRAELGQAYIDRLRETRASTAWSISRATGSAAHKTDSGHDAVRAWWAPVACESERPALHRLTMWYGTAGRSPMRSRQCRGQGMPH